MYECNYTTQAILDDYFPDGLYSKPTHMCIKPSYNVITTKAIKKTTFSEC